MLKGLGVGVLGFTGVTRARGDDTVEIVTQRDREGPFKTIAVPSEWDEAVKRSRRVRREIEDSYGDREDVVDVKRTRWEEEFGGKNGLKVTAVVSSEDAKEDIPDEEDGIEIEVVYVVPEKGPQACQGFTSDIDPAKGGIGCSANEDGTTTLGVEKDSIDADDLLLTAAHLFEGNCSGDIRGNELSQGGDHYGVVEEYDAEEDWAVVVGEDWGEDSTGEIKDERGVWPVSCWYTRCGIEHLISEEKTVFQMGTTTGQTSGPVGALDSSDGFDCVDFDGNGVECYLTNAEGDSGGPIYTYDEEVDKAVMICISQMWVGEVWTRSCRGYTDLVESGTVRGTGFYHIENQHDIYPKV